MKQALQMASRETLPILKEALVTLTLGQHPLTTWVFVSEIFHMFILGLYITYTHNAPMNFRGHVVQLGNAEVPLRHPGVQLHSTPV